jgi:hypothetical protein
VSSNVSPRFCPESISIQPGIRGGRCRERGRDPESLRRSLLCFGSLDPWSSELEVADLVARFREIGITEFVFFWPPEGRMDELLDVLAAR